MIEEFLPGEELSFFALTDGTSLVPLPVVGTTRRSTMAMKARTLAA